MATAARESVLAAPAAAARGWLVRLLSLLAVAAAVPSVVQVLFGTPDHDVAWSIYVGGRLLDGARLYVDVLEVNPPLVFLLGAAAAWVGRVTGADAMLVLEGAVLLAAGGSLWLTARLLRLLAPEGAAAAGREALLLAATFALLGVSASSNVFAQREHLLVILLLPYLVVAAARALGVAVPRRLAVVAGVLGGAGVALKPFFVAPWGLVELYVAAARRTPRVWLRAESVAVVAVNVAYVVAVVVLAPGYLALAGVLLEVYGGFLRLSYREMVADWRTGVLVLALAAAALAQTTPALRRLRGVLAAATVGFALALAVQHKGWAYHWYPVLAGCALLLGVVLASAVTWARPRRVAPGAMALAAAALLVWRLTADVRGSVHPAPGSPYMRDLIPRATEIMREWGGGESVGALSALPMPMFPAVNEAGARWTGRFFHLWALSAPYRAHRWDPSPPRYHRPAEMGRAERFVYEAVLADMRRDPPRLLFVMHGPDMSLPTLRFDYLAYFAQDAGFARAIADYEVVDSVGLYRVYRRRAPAPSRAASGGGSPVR